MTDQEILEQLESEAREHLAALAVDQSKWEVGEYELLPARGWLFMQRVQKPGQLDSTDVKFWMHNIKFDRTLKSIFQYEVELEF